MTPQGQAEEKRGVKVGEPESQGEDLGGSQETASDGVERARRLRAQAELAWARVQRVAQQRARSSRWLERAIHRAEQVPTESYLAATSASLLTAAWLYGTGRRTTGMSIAVWGPAAMAVGLYLRATRKK